MKYINSAKFISFEGGEGCGKSTQCLMLRDHLVSQNIEVILTREPGGTTQAEEIRKIILYSELLPTTELMLVMAARYEHLSKVILPALDKNIWVICDRFIDSTAVYQSQAVNKVDEIYTLHQQLLSNRVPDLTFIIDLPVNVALLRAKTRGANNKFEAKGINFHHNIRNRFLEISNMFKDRIVNINADQLSKEEIHAKVVDYLTQNN
ncbi:MAG: dTMP kinase [Rickettsiaceae bacterium]|nr:MAG: dTMP kinase [Rickettsiaceae bacterium]